MVNVKSQLSLKKAIEIYEKRRAIEDKKKTQRQLGLNNAKKKFLKYKLLSKLKLSKEIFAWCKRFVKSEEYRKLKCEVNNEGLIALEIYPNAPLGHLPKNQSPSRAWSYIYLLKNGSLHYNCASNGGGLAGAFPGSRIFKTPESLAKGLGYGYIFNLHGYLISGRFEEDEAERLVKGNESLSLLKQNLFYYPSV